ncbi:MAG: BamA/TamA family outer membrane protein [Gammaproteobacteria bacterium]|nr:BamA/TamA family outer membrane protein [Gammaproteobacteria bacterium]
MTIEGIDITITGAGADSEEFRQLRQDSPFAKGQRLEHQVYSDYKNRLSRRARELGYFDARFMTHTLRVNPDKHRAAIILEFDTGPRYRYGPISFTETPFSDEFLRNYIPFKEGEPYSSRGPLKLREALLNSDMFSTVEVRPDETAGDELEVPVEVRLEPRKPHRYSAGVGFATDTGPRLSLGWNARYLNERGHQFSSELQVSPVTSNLSGTYLMPYFRNRPADIGLRTALKNEDTDTANSRSGQATLFQNRTRWGWNETLSASYLVEDFKIAGERERDTSKLLIPGVNWRKSWSDDPVYAQRGGRLSLDLKGAAEPLLSDTSFIQARISGKYVRALGFRNRLLARLEFGATGVTDFDDLPASLRFYAGGDNSVRGYDYQSWARG